MIIIFAYENNFLTYISLLLQYATFNYIILTKYDREYFEQACVIIPLGIGAQLELNKYKKYKDKFLICSQYTYQMLDDKKDFYHFIKKHEILKRSHIKLIPTYNKYYQGSNKFGKFIVKNCTGAGSSENKIVRGKLYSIIDNYSKYQIQDILDIKYVYSINCLAHNGKLVSSLNFIINGFIEEDFYHKNKKEQVQHVSYEFRSVIEKIIYKSDYNGILEIEFIIDKNNNAYLMECNPRVSSNMKCVDDHKNIVPFIEYIIKPYSDIIHNEPVRNANLYSDKCDVTYYGTIKYKYQKYDCVIEIKDKY